MESGSHWHDVQKNSDHLKPLYPIAYLINELCNIWQIAVTRNQVLGCDVKCGLTRGNNSWILLYSGSRLSLAFRRHVYCKMIFLCKLMWDSEVSEGGDFRLGEPGSVLNKGIAFVFAIAPMFVCWLSSVRRVQGPKQTAHWARCPQILQACRSHLRSLGARRVLGTHKY